MEKFGITPASEKSRQSALIFGTCLAFIAVVEGIVIPVLGWIMAAAMLFVACLVFRLNWAMSRAACILSLDSLTIQADVFGRRIARSALLAADARVVSLPNEPQLQPKWRTFGTAWPGYLSGWFRLRSKQKAFIAVTDQDRVVYLPTTQGYVLLLSLERPEEFLQALREGA